LAKSPPRMTEFLLEGSFALVHDPHSPRALRSSRQLCLKRVLGGRDRGFHPEVGFECGRKGRMTYITTATRPRRPHSAQCGATAATALPGQILSTPWPGAGQGALRAAYKTARRSPVPAKPSSPVRLAATLLHCLSVLSVVRLNGVRAGTASLFFLTRSSLSTRVPTNDQATPG
jgi:hypothetical protein